MTDVYIESGDQPSSPSDAELILEVRGGDLDAYGALYARHAGAARRLAQSYVRNAADADDVVADAFARVLRVLQSGRGPDQMFRAYLFTVVKNVAIELAKGTRRMQPTDDEATFETALFSEVSSEDPTLAGFEKTVVSRAYRNLPERWQAVLWYTEVEGYTPAQIAPVLGLTANGVSALAYRAREGLRVGYLQEHLSGFTADGCRTVNPLLGGYVRGSLASREIAKVDTHLKTCGDCRTLVLELSDVAHGMRGVIAPLILGGLGLGLVSALPLGALVGAGATSAAGAAGGAGVVGGAATGAAMSGSVGAAGSAGTAGAAAGAGVGAGATGATGVGAGLAGATGTATGAVAGTAAGATTAGAAVTSGAGSIAAGLGAATASVATTAGSAAAATGATAVAAAGTAATATTAATAATAATATASTAVASTLAASAAGAGAVVGTSSMAAAASAVAVAAVGVVTVLHALAPSSGDIPVPQATSIVTTVPGLLAPSEIGPVEPVLPQVSPSQVPEFAQAPVAALVAPASLAVAPVSTGTLEPRVPQRLKLTVANTGEQTAVGTTVRLDLADGLTPVFASSTGAKGAPLAAVPLDAAALCRAADDDADVVCRLGDVPGGATTTFAFDVVARSGGTYDITGQVWAAGLKPAAIAVLPAVVDGYGAELTAALGSLDDLANPGVGTLPVSVVNSGDKPAAAGWSLDVTLPDGLAFAGVDGALACTADAQSPQHLTCAATNPAILSPGVGRFASLRVLAPATLTSGTVTAGAVPVAADGGHVVGGAGSIKVQASWAGAAPVGTTAWCAASGNLATADAVVGGTFVNTTSQTVTPRLEAAGSAVVGRALAPGESVQLTLHDGARVPAGAATWILSTTVAGREYTTSVGGGEVAATDCYVPEWDVTTSVVPRNEAGQVRLTGTITNKTTEAMRADLRAAGRTSAPVTVAAGESATLVLDTQASTLPAGVATFGLTRWVTDVDGDQPAAAVEPATPATVRYDAAVLAPAIGGAGQAWYVDDCVYDPASETSSRTVAVTVDNSGSTLPVAFTVGTVAVTVPAGETRTVEQRVVAGTTALEVLADGRSLGAVPVNVASCASFAWPADVSASAQARCVPAGGPDSRPSVAVAVSDATGRSYEARTRLVRGPWTGAVAVPGGGTADLVLDPGSGLRARGGNVVVELARTIEGARYTAEQTVGYDAVNCVSREPGARLELGDVVVNQSGWWPTSSRTVGVVLDNTGSNVPVRFVVSGGPDGGTTQRTVRAGQTLTVDLGSVAGRTGASISVRTDGWSTTLAVDPFTGTAGWCAPGWDGATEARGGYTAGDVVSYGATSYRYLGAAKPASGGNAGTGSASPGGPATTPGATGVATSGQASQGTIDGADRSDDRSTATGRDGSATGRDGSASGRDRDRGTAGTRWGGRSSGGGVSRSVGQAVPLFGSWVTPPPRSDVWQAAGSCEWRWPGGAQTTP